MNIIIVAPKMSSTTPIRFDYAFWNFYIPLLKLGHKVSFFDTSKLGNKDLKIYIDKLKPDLLFCIMTGNSGYCPDEPWETISQETSKGNINTFNWFCDDSYRLNSFSKNVCNLFRWCSTPEKKYIKNYKDFGYTNIIYSTWHANSDVYYQGDLPKVFDLSFIGGMHGDRISYLNYLSQNSKKVTTSNNKLSFEDMIYVYCSSKVCLNFTKDASNAQTQMKARIFEILATKSILLTEYTEDLDNCFRKESLFTFTTKEELLDKIDWISNNDCKDLQEECYSNFLLNHDSSVRLKNLLDTIQ